MEAVGFIYIVLAIAAMATMAYLLHNKYVLWALYIVSLAAFLFVMFADVWTATDPFYHKIGISIALVGSSLFGLLLAIKVVEFITPDVVIGTQSRIIESKFSYGLLNLFAPIITMVVLGVVSTEAYRHSFNTSAEQLPIKERSFAESASPTWPRHAAALEVASEPREVPAATESVLATQRTAGPSFDCAKATSVPERLICSDAELSRMDADLETLYRRATAVAPDKAELRRINVEQWRQRELGCSDKECLLAWYRMRHQELQYVIKSNELNSR